MIGFARTLEAKSYAYRLETELYFDTGKVRDYGSVVRRRNGTPRVHLPGAIACAGFA
jgi:cysteinyl-tRNA synthetase